MMNLRDKANPSSLELSKKIQNNFDSVTVAIDAVLNDRRCFDCVKGDHDGRKLLTSQRAKLTEVVNDLTLHQATLGKGATNAVYKSTIKVLNTLLSGSKNLSHAALELRDALINAGVPKTVRATSVEGVLMSVKIAVEKLKADQLAEIRRTSVSSLVSPEKKSQPVERKAMAFGGLGLTEFIKGLKPGTHQEVTDQLKAALVAEQEARRKMAREEVIARRVPSVGQQAIPIRSGMAGAYDLGSNVERLFPKDAALDRKV